MSAAPVRVAGRRRMIVVVGAVVVALIAALLVWRASGGSASSFGKVNTIDPVVGVRAEGSDGYRTARRGHPVSEGDQVRTDATGFAEIGYFDGSVTRLDVHTNFVVTKLVQDAGKREIKTRLDRGRSWNRVAKLTATEGSFEVETVNAVAAVRGTTFVVDCRRLPVCTFIVIDGVVEVTTEKGDKITLRAGDAVTVGADGELGQRREVPLSEVAEDPWLERNLRLDGRAVPTDAPAAESAPTQQEGDEAAAPPSPDTSVASAGTRRPASPTTTAPARRAQTFRGVSAGESAAAATSDSGSAAPPPSETSAPPPSDPQPPPPEDPAPPPPPPPPPPPSTPARVAFTSNRDLPSSYEIYTLTSDGAIQRVTTDGCDPMDAACTTRIANSQPDWSPDGSRIAFVKTTGYTSRVYVMNADGTGATPISRVGLDPLSVAWSPDGTRLAFENISGGEGIYVVNADGTGETLVPNSAGFLLPTWSPDGSRLAAEAFDSASGVTRIAVVNVDGSGLRYLTDAADGDAKQPDWSPDGQEIAFAHNSNSACAGSIAVVDAEGATAPQDLPHVGCTNYAPSWSSDGTKIVFASIPAGGEPSDDLYVVNRDDWNIVQLTNDAPIDTEPSFFGSEGIG